MLDEAQCWDAVVAVGGLLASLTLRHGTVTTVLAAAAMMGVPAAVLGPYLIRRATRSTTDSEPEVPAPPRSCVPGK